MEFLHAADAAFIDERYDDAIEGYNAAADEIPGNAEIYTRRAAAHLKLGNYTAAKKDASLSIKMRPAPMSYVRKGRACFALEEWSEARTAFGSALDLDRGANVAVKTVEMQRWIRKCDAELASAGTAASSAVGSAALPPQNARPDAPAAAPPKPDASRIRHEWYQTQTHVVVSVLVRGVSAEQCAVGFDAAAVDVSIKLDGSSEYQLSLQLFQKIVPSECKWSVGGAKLELKLKKAAPGKWEALEGDGDGGLESFNAVPPPPPAAAASSSSSSAAAADADAAPSKKVYSGSSRDWDKIDADLTKAEAEEKPEGEEALNKLFREIYKNANEDTRRAMNKSFQTSGGTVLSTNWDEVGTKDYEKEKTAPDGQEWKKWG